MERVGKNIDSIGRMVQEKLVYLVFTIHFKGLSVEFLLSPTGGRRKGGTVTDLPLIKPIEVGPGTSGPGVGPLPSYYLTLLGPRDCSITSCDTVET